MTGAAAFRRCLFYGEDTISGQGAIRLTVEKTGPYFVLGLDGRQPIFALWPRLGRFFLSVRSCGVYSVLPCGWGGRRRRLTFRKSRRITNSDAWQDVVNRVSPCPLMVHMGHQKNRFPRIGMRIAKSAVAVGVCFLIYYLRGSHGIPFYTAIAALQCMQSYHKSSRKVAARRINGTFIGAVYGLIGIVIQCFILEPNHIHYTLYCAVVMLGVVASLYTAVVLNCQDAAYFSSVVFLCITMVHIGDENPYIFVLNRVTETLIGVIVGVAVNAFHLPRRKRKDVLFVTALDDVLISENTRLSDYSKVELNRLIDEGIPLSIMTRRTTASFLEAAGDVHVKLPLVLMDGAVLYNPVENSYLFKCELSYEETCLLTEKLRSLGLEVFQNVVMDDSSLIFYESLDHESSRRLYDKLRRSPYRNYLNRPLPEGQPAVYLLAVDEPEKIRSAFEALQAGGDAERYKIVCGESEDYPELLSLKIYNKDAEKLNTLEKLKEVTGYRTAITFGSIPELYDICVRASDGDDVVKYLKDAFEPVIWKRGKRT